ncbi:hypothetical protein [Limnohabitans sp. Rim8]|uniref:hypothetical protein n=1 Tax=Limnohabitans sp. Rim8 TaxID=1100718 RepID=UPI0033059AC4
MNFLRQHIQLKGYTGSAVIAAAVSALLAACSSPPAQPPPPASVPAPLPLPLPLPAPAARPMPTAPPASQRPPQLAKPESTINSQASTPREYRKDAASHLYKLNSNRIYKGRMPPMLHAIGVLDVELDRQGRVMSIHWKRAPAHAPEVMADIEQLVRQAAPYPAPARMGKVIYTDVWLWHKSGKFQLDTLTEGQD